jgi:DNA-binding transcriptional regulator LsrR (DeoR family)
MGGGTMIFKELMLLDMYFEDGMKEAEIAESLGMTVLEVNEVLAAFESGKADIHPDLFGEEV